jgi:hypothetical protein
LPSYEYHRLFGVGRDSRAGSLLPFVDSTTDSVVKLLVVLSCGSNDPFVRGAVLSALWGAGAG